MGPSKAKQFLNFITSDADIPDPVRRGLLHVAMRNPAFKEALSSIGHYAVFEYPDIAFLLIDHSTQLKVYYSPTPPQNRKGIKANSYPPFNLDSLPPNELRKLEKRCCQENLDTQASLIWAARMGYEGLVEAHFKAGVKPTDVRYKGRTPLIEAVLRGHIKIAETLLKNGVSPDEADSYGNSPLLAAIRSGDIEITKLLLEHGAKAQPDSLLLPKPLIVAAKLGHTSIVQFLLQYEANPKEFDAYTYLSELNALVASAMNGHTETVEILLPHFGYNDQINLEHAQDIAGIRNYHETARLIGDHIHQLRMNPPLKDKDRRHSVTVSMSL